MNTADVIRELERSPRRIKVKCPNDHFISDITLSVLNGQLTMRRERSGNELRRRASQGKGALYGEVVAEDDKKTVLTCANSYCTYSPSRSSELVALELAQAALRGHAEHRLIW